MIIKIERNPKKKRYRRKKRKNIGFSNRLAIYTLLFLAAGLIGGFYLAIKSIQYQYTGPLVCWTVVFTPIGTAVGFIPHFVVHKSTVENSGADGEGIKFAAAKAVEFLQGDETENSPLI